MSITTPRVLVIVEAAKPDVLELNIMSPVAVERIEKWYSWQAQLTARLILVFSAHDRTIPGK